MIQKITYNEYLKRLDNMTAAEKEDYLDRVGEWIRRQAPMLMRKTDDPVAVFQNAVQCSTGWNDNECQAWNEGVRLLTAMTGKADTWLPEMLYTKSAKRTIRKMVDILNTERSDGAQSQRMIAGAAKEAGYGKTAKEEPAAESHGAGQGKPQYAGQAQPEPSAVKPTPVRPTHIDQYVHLLPESTQKKAAMVKGLLRDLDVARENARLLMSDPKAKSDSVAQWAKAATALDTKVKGIYKELDAEWDKLVKSGSVVVDDLGNARVVEPAVAQQGSRQQDVGQKQELSDEDKAKIKSLRSWLRDTRGPKEDGEKKDAYVARWKEKYLEIVKIGGKDVVTEAIVKAADLYGINLDELQSNGNTTDETDKS